MGSAVTHGPIARPQPVGSRPDRCAALQRSGPATPTMRECEGLTETDDVIAVAVQTYPDPSPKRIARRRHVLEMGAGPYEIRGVVHMPPGADPQRYVRATSQRWIATKGTVVDGDNGEAYEIGALPVNMEHVTRT